MTPLLWAITCHVSGLRDFIVAHATVSGQITRLLPADGRFGKIRPLHSRPKQKEPMLLSKAVHLARRLCLLRRGGAIIGLLAIPIMAHTSDVAPVLVGEELVRALRAGGYNLYFRHAQTDWSAEDHIARAGDWESCEPARVRQLSEDGRRTAAAVGRAIRSLGIPVGRVLASPYCRTVETANLMRLGKVETTTDIMNLRVAEFFGGREAIVARARKRLAAPPAPGTNTVLVAHGNVAREATPVYPDEAEGAVFQPDGNGDFRYVGRIGPREWTELAAVNSRD